MEYRKRKSVVLCHRNISVRVKGNVYKTVAIPVVMYGAERTIRGRNENVEKDVRVDKPSTSYASLQTVTATMCSNTCNPTLSQDTTCNKYLRDIRGSVYLSV